ncbi:MAG TPA: PilZ domain-containing protein [Terriglobales bacterium]|nr:PilZ domain-containing protein [Terriglobales bacterium]
MELAIKANGASEIGRLEKGGLVSEARTGKRFPLELPIKIQGQNQGSVTGNMSAAGVYIRGNPALEIGSSVEFEIALPPELTGSTEHVIVQCKGRVVRKDEGAGDEGHGVACVIDSYDFVRQP